ncbi:hypothetical protein [Chlamydia pecorum]|uniref:Uncharacterized protein n=1 Tax=Chlamydia pecorum (strain ATCC VR-628 / DSM 29919 / E58) TaxID=331635 RepID=A0AA34RCI8_CHLPE|nr:hypothetical protein [Chlamydia pecorum]AEB41216.1 conserved hypothetical protein [Chlamydia pecorum E58]UFP06797.1 hypothetical protein KY091_00215 [Chlamydia pecorum]UJT76599.1 hypothetical protein NSWBovSBE_0183 [Chlamydia pecorum]
MHHDHHNIPEADPYFLDDDVTHYSEEMISLDRYQETGVYVEEEKEKEKGDILIVFGNSLLQGTTRQIYISEDNHTYTRSYYKNRWGLWSSMPLKTISSKTYDLNSLKEPHFLLTTNVEKLINAPENLPKGSESLDNMILSIASRKVHHHIQFFIADNRRTFWIRHHHNDSSWSPWQTFI